MIYYWRGAQIKTILPAILNDLKLFWYYDIKLTMTTLIIRNQFIDLRIYSRDFKVF